MKLYYYRHKNGVTNFGDDLNPWLWNKLLPGSFDNESDEVLIGIGTLLNDQLDGILPGSAKKIVFSSGVGYSDGIPKIDHRWDIMCVRGPLSANKLGLDSKLAITDGAVLVQKVFEYSGGKKYKFSFMPHLSQALAGGRIWANVCAGLDFQYIDPQWSTEAVLSAISNSNVLITEALHGAIVADTLRVPWIPVISNKMVYQFKWNDWCASMGLEYSPHHIFPVWDSAKTSFWKQGKSNIKEMLVKNQLARLSKRKPVLSMKSKLSELVERLDNKLEKLKSRYEI